MDAKEQKKKAAEKATLTHRLMEINSERDAILSRLRELNKEEVSE